MCGICGMLHSDPARPVDPAVVRQMTDALVHRGPDDDGYLFDGPVGMGMRRLSIIDVAGGKQPIANEDGNVHVVYNGEIYNYRELRRELEGNGHRFSTHSDTEVVVHAYEEDGPGCLTRLRGMFSLALWDSGARSLLLAVDRFGIKPLYYVVRGEGIAFGSELKCLLLSGLATREIDQDALGQYFTFGYVPPPATIFAGVRKLAPGSLLLWSAERGASVQRYWETPLDTLDPERSVLDTRRHLEEALLDAVRSHLVSDVPVGAFLSGGIDSSALVALMREAGQDGVRTFSIGFSEARYSELDKARLVARQYDTDHHELVVEPESVDLLPRLAAHFDEPFADASALPTYHVSRLARQHVKVVLSGDGGDELFLGYSLFRGLKLAEKAQRLPAGLRRILAALPGYAPTTGSASANDRIALLFKRIADTMLTPELAYKRKIAAPGLGSVAPFLSPELRAGLEQRDPFAVVDRWLEAYSSANGSHSLDRFVYSGFQTSLAGDMLVKVDRMSMANSLEVRVPLLDHLLAEFVATIPIGRRMPGWRLKGLLKDTVGDRLPDAILKQRKRGFVVPVGAWFRGDMSGFVQDVLVSSELKHRGFLDVQTIERMLAHHRAGAPSLGPVIWSLLMFELWCREMLDSPVSV